MDRNQPFPPNVRGVQDFPPYQYANQSYAPVYPLRRDDTKHVAGGWPGSYAMAGLPDPSNDNSLAHPSQKIITSKHIFAIDSRSRDCRVYPNPNHYKIAVEPPFKNVNSVELKAAVIPKTEYNVNSDNNLIDFSEDGGATLTATLTIGQYEIGANDGVAGLLREIKTQMEAVGVGTYDVDLVSGTGVNTTLLNRIRITRTDGAPDPFNLLFLTGPNPRRSSRTLLGFNCADTGSATTHTADSDFNLLDDPKYVVLKFSAVNDLDRVSSPDDEVLEGAFALLIFDNNQSDVLTPPDAVSPNRLPGVLKPLKGSDFDRKILEWLTPEGKLSNLCIEFLTWSGDRYDFHNREHLLIFEFVCNDINTNNRY